MPRPQIVIENPILNTPFAEPERHFRFDDEGITDDVVEGRRPSSYFMPTAPSPSDHINPWVLPGSSCGSSTRTAQCVR